MSFVKSKQKIASDSRGGKERINIMVTYHNAQICKNGHVIAYYDKYFTSDNHCSICGSQIIENCLECGKPIHGSEYNELSYLFEYVRPNYCYFCGKAYPWTKSAIEATAELIKVEQNITDEEKENTISDLSNIVCETPRTALAVTRAKVIASKSGKFVADGIRQFAIDFGCELAKKMFGLD